jgi:hypothetical protein
MSQTHFPPNWDGRLLAVVGADPGYQQGRRLLGAWATAEGGTAKWNPLNTTYGLPGATDYNSVGVKNYRRPTEGVCATALTLVNGYYPHILAALQGGTRTAEQIVNDFPDEFRRWGTNPQTILEVLAS